MRAARWLVGFSMHRLPSPKATDDAGDCSSWWWSGVAGGAVRSSCTSSESAPASRAAACRRGLLTTSEPMVVAAAYAAFCSSCFSSASPRSMLRAARRSRWISSGIAPASWAASWLAALAQHRLLSATAATDAVAAPPLGLRMGSGPWKGTGGRWGL